MNIESQNRILPARALQTRDLRDELVLWSLTSSWTRVLLCTLLLMRVLILIVALPCLSCLSCLSLISILPRNMLLRLARRRRIRSIRSRIIAPIRRLV